MAVDKLAITLANDAMSEALVISLQKLAKLQAKHDALVAVQDELVEALKVILDVCDDYQLDSHDRDFDNKTLDARRLVANLEAK